MLPKISGTDILKRIREKNIQTPVIMLSALSEVEIITEFIKNPNQLIRNKHLE